MSLRLQVAIAEDTRIARPIIVSINGTRVHELDRVDALAMAAEIRGSQLRASPAMLEVASCLERLAVDLADAVGHA